MATKAEWVTTLKAQNPSLTKMVDGVVSTLDSTEYNTTIDSWAQASYDQEVRAALIKDGGQSADYVFARTDPTSGSGYPTLGNQLDLLYKDIAAGKLGEDAKTGGWYTAVKAVKDKYTKPA